MEQNLGSGPVVVARSLGYGIASARTFTFDGVDLSKATAARFDFGTMGVGGQSLQYRFNGGAFHTYVVPKVLTESLYRAASEVVPLSELTPGRNTVEVVSVDLDVPTIGNMDLTIEIP